MIRLVRIPGRQGAELKRRARRAGVPVSRLIRDAIRSHLVWRS